jgi:hypothetical protein
MAHVGGLFAFASEDQAKPAESAGQVDPDPSEKGKKRYRDRRQPRPVTDQMRPDRRRMTQAPGNELEIVRNAPDRESGGEYFQVEQPYRVRRDTGSPCRASGVQNERRDSDRQNEQRTKCRHHCPESDLFPSAITIRMHRGFLLPRDPYKDGVGQRGDWQSGQEDLYLSHASHHLDKGKSEAAATTGKLQKTLKIVHRRQSIRCRWPCNNSPERSPTEFFRRSASISRTAPSIPQHPLNVAVQEHHFAYGVPVTHSWRL